MTYGHLGNQGTPSASAVSTFLSPTPALHLRAPCHHHRLHRLDKIKKQQGYVGGEKVLNLDLLKSHFFEPQTSKE